MSKFTDWFNPDQQMILRTDREFVSIFVTTHFLGPFLAQPMFYYLWFETNASRGTLMIEMIGTWSFVLLPFILRKYGRFHLLSFISFQLLAVIGLFGSLHFGGFNSPFLHWVIVSLLLGLFYHSQTYWRVLGLFIFDLMVFAFFVIQRDTTSDIPLDQLKFVGWLSVGAATVYIAWMTYYYSRIVGLKSELETEAELGRKTSLELERALAVANDFAERRSRFFSKVNHELRTPLNAIIGYSELLIEDLELGGEVENRHHSDLNRIKAAGQHLLSLVSRVLDLNSIEEDENQILPVAVTLGQFRDDVFASVGPTVQRSGNTFAIICDEPHYQLWTDATKLRQIVINFLSNSAKFTSKGVVKLELSIIKICENDFLKAEVSDTGIGINQNILTRIFDNYEQANKETVAKYGGTGIGLALSRHLATLLGGRILVTSIEGRGSSFTALIPVRYPLDPTDSSANVSEHHTQKINVSLAERSESLQIGTRSLT